jgi:uncharacterized protein
MGLEEFKCLQCGNCCLWSGYVRLTEDEVDQIAGHLGISVEEFVEKRTRLTNDRRCLSLNENSDGSCIFYSKDSRVCEINSVKPLQCRSFPMHWNFLAWEQTCRWGIEKSETDQAIEENLK